MGIRRTLQEGVRKSVIEFMPSVPFYFVDTNGYEEVTPYCTIEIPSFQSTAKEEVTTYLSGDEGSTYLTIREIYEATARFSFCGKNLEDNDAADFAFELASLLQTPLLQMKFEENNISYLRKSIIRKIPKPRETKWYDAYVLDAVFSFVVETRQQVGHVESVEVITRAFDLGGNLVLEETTIVDEDSGP